LITISETIIPPVMALGLPFGRTDDVGIIRTGQGFETLGGIPLPAIQNEFLAIIGEIAPEGFDSGITFMRVMESQPAVLNETHRDKGDENTLNFTCLVSCGDSLQLEFFEDNDFFEQNPQIIPNGHVIMCSKELHRCPDRPEQGCPMVFLSANLYRKAAA
jgi:hypothetical protein